MKIDEAIDRNIELLSELKREGHLENSKAVLLGIQALRRIKHAREQGVKARIFPLPGETKD